MTDDRLTVYKTSAKTFGFFHYKNILKSACDKA